jgi:hypothetical protein
MCGYLFAAYAVARLPESNRVCAWVAPGWSYNNILDMNAPRPRRNRPKSVAALIAYSTDGDGDGIAESGWCFAQHDTIDMGMKMKPVTCPVLADLVLVWKQATQQHAPGVIDAPTAARMAGHLGTLLPLVQTSVSWFETIRDVAGVFDAARRLGEAVHIG